MLRVGLTGGVASGKSTVARLFAGLGADVVDTDEIARELVLPGSPALAAIVERFGQPVIAADGSLDRRRLRKLVFADAARRRELEAILHPPIRAEALARAAASTAPYVILVVPLLFESGFNRLVDRTLLVDCPEEKQIERLIARDGAGETEARAMLAAQMARAERRAAADDRIDNSGSLESTKTQVRQLHERYLALAQIARAPEVAQNSGMAEAPRYQTDPGTESRLIAFEQPLNERMRSFLRVEFLHGQALLHARHEAAYGARAAVANLLEILTITSRGDIRADALKELDRHGQRLGNFRRSPGVDTDRLTRLLGQVDANRQALADVGKNFLAPLRENEFLSAIRHRSAIPGGTCMFDLPDFGYWLQLPGPERSRQLKAWLDQLKPLCDAIDLLLWLAREASTPARLIAPGGLYNLSLSKEDNYDLVRVLVPESSGLYPEISAGQHRFTVRFAEWQGTEMRARQAASDVPFFLALC